MHEFNVDNLFSVSLGGLIRLVLMGNESQLRDSAEKIRTSLKAAVTVDVVGVDMEEDREAVFDEAVGTARSILGNLDAFVHCYSYEGKNQFFPLLNSQILCLPLFYLRFCSC